MNDTSYSHFLKITFRIFLLLFLAIRVNANSLPVFYIDSVSVYTDLAKNHASYWVDESETITIKDILKNENSRPFQPVGEGLPNLKKVFWCKWQVQNNIQEPSVVKNWILDIGKGDHIDIYFVNSKGQIIETQKTGEQTPMSLKKLSQKHFVERIPFSIPPNEKITIYFRLYRYSGFPPQLKLELHQKDFYDRDDYQAQVPVRWMFFGTLFTLFFFGLGFFAVTRDRTFLYYGLFIFGLGGYFVDAIFNVYGNILFFREHPILIMYLVYVLVTFMNVFHILFIQKYINSKNDFPKWNRLANYAVILNVVTGLVAWVVYFFTKDEFLTSKIIIPAIILTYFFLFTIIFPILRLKEKKMEHYIILFSISLFTFMIFINAVSIFNGTNLRILETQLILMGLILIFSLGLIVSLGFRFHQHQTEKQQITRQKDLNEIKTKFYQNITHEFRTPLTIIKGVTQEVQEELGQGNQSHFVPKLEMIQRNGDNLLQLVNKLLSLAKLEQKEEKLNLHRGDFIQHLRFLIQSMESFAKDKNVQLNFNPNESSLMMDFDEEKTRQIILNILSNALKFSKENTTVSVTTQKSTWNNLSSLLIEVQDQGIGMKPKELEMVFERFYQGEKNNTTSQQGSGIGLALTKGLVKLMDGDIELESKLDKGTLVKIHLPIHNNSATENESTTSSPAESIAIQKTIATQPINDQTDINLNTQLPLVLVIEDNHDLRTYLENILNEKYNIITAKNGQEGIDIALEKIPDLIVSDVMMPIKNGYEVCDALKNNIRTSHIPILLLTAKITQTDRLEGFSRGADAYLLKPFEKIELEIRLENLIINRRKIQQRVVKSIPTTSKPITGLDGKDQKFLEEVTQYFQDNLSNEGVDIPNLERKMLLSRSQLFRKIKAITGETPMNFKKQLRLKLAFQKLKEEDISIKEIAYDVGYKYPSHFSKDFKSFYGVSPKEVAQ